MISCSMGIGRHPKWRPPYRHRHSRDGSRLGAIAPLIVMATCGLPISARRRQACWATRSLVARIGHERPDAVFLTGDVLGMAATGPIMRSSPGDSSWRSEQLRVYPVLATTNQGVHGGDCCAVVQAFPQESGRRWYSVAFGGQLQIIALDSDSSLRPAANREWLKGNWMIFRQCALRLVLVASPAGH